MKLRYFLFSIYRLILGAWPDDGGPRGRYFVRRRCVNNNNTGHSFVGETVRGSIFTFARKRTNYRVRVTYIGHYIIYIYAENRTLSKANACRIPYAVRFG